GYEAADDFVQVDQRRLERLASAEREELPDERGRPVGRRHDRRRVLLRLAVEPRLEQLAVAADRADHVVEVVRDLAGEAPDRLEFLRLAPLLLASPQRLLRLAPLGEVARERREERRSRRLHACERELDRDLA